MAFALENMGVEPNEIRRRVDEALRNAMKNYFEGNATKDEALDLFYKAVEEKYPELTH